MEHSSPACPSLWRTAHTGRWRPLHGHCHCPERTPRERGREGGREKERGRERKKGRKREREEEREREREREGEKEGGMHVHVSRERKGGKGEKRNN